MSKGITTLALEAYSAHRAEANSAFALFQAYCDGPLGAVPGMPTKFRLAYRISLNLDLPIYDNIERAAAKEYLYRWHLAIKPPDMALAEGVRDPAKSIFGTPHAIGL